MVKDLLQEQDFLRQRAKVFWLKERDVNTKYFHNSAKFRKKLKVIEKLKDANRVWVDDNDGLCRITDDYFCWFVLG